MLRPRVDLVVLRFYASDVVLAQVFDAVAYPLRRELDGAWYVAVGLVRAHDPAYDR